MLKHLTRGHNPSGVKFHLLIQLRGVIVPTTKLIWMVPSGASKSRPRGRQILLVIATEKFDHTVINRKKLITDKIKTRRRQEKKGPMFMFKLASVGTSRCNCARHGDLGGSEGASKQSLGSTGRLLLLSLSFTGHGLGVKNF